LKLGKQDEDIGNAHLAVVVKVGDQFNTHLSGGECSRRIIA
jgi:hypothetical protein